MRGRRGSLREELAKAGWSRFTYCLAGFFILFGTAVTTAAVLSNPTSQLSICCYALCAVAMLMLLVGLTDRR